jgi:hypothetical protein
MLSATEVPTFKLFLVLAVFRADLVPKAQREPLATTVAMALTVPLVLPDPKAPKESLASSCRGPKATWVL